MKKIMQIRVTQRLHDYEYKRLEIMSTHIGSSKSEVTRRALEKYWRDFLAQSKKPAA